MKRISPYWFLLLLLAICFSLSTVVVSRADNGAHPQSENVLITMLGGRQFLAKRLFFRMGDVYFHSGYYPSIFDNQDAGNDVADPAHGRAEDIGDDFFGPPKDWIDALERHFVPNQHTHLNSGGAMGSAKAGTVAEVLPWMKLSSEMDPHMIDSYTVGAYWLQSALKKPDDARQFLLQGLRANPGNPELLFDLGQLYERSYHDTNRAENVWIMALQNWQRQDETLKTNLQSQYHCEEITTSLAHANEVQGNLSGAIHYFEIAKTVSATPETIQQNIDRIRQTMQNTATNSPAR